MLVLLTILVKVTVVAETVVDVDDVLCKDFMFTVQARLYIIPCHSIYIYNYKRNKQRERFPTDRLPS
jgi:hypothetical protein